MATKRLRRVTAAEARSILATSVNTFDRMLARGVFTVRKDGRAKASKRYLFLDEVETYVEANAGGTGVEGARAVLALRVEKRRKRR